jgi:DNA-binding beta-propeller fold protein YncE
VIEGISGIAVNVDGNGPDVVPGDIYVVDKGNNRVQQLRRTADAEGRRFVRAFGLDVGGSGVDVCTVRTSCQAGTASGAAGGLNRPVAVAVDQATGNVYVTDDLNHRIDVFRADGVFEGAFGWNVNATAPAEELQFCTTATGCQAGSAGGGAGQFGELGNETSSAELRAIRHAAVAPEGAPDAGNLVVANSTNNRIDEFEPVLDSGGEVTGVEFVGGYGWNVDPIGGSGSFETCTVAGGGCQAGTPGASIGQFNSRGLTGVAVDTTGAIYAVNSPDAVAGCSSIRPCRVLKLNPTRTGVVSFAPGQLDRTSGGRPETIGVLEIAVDPTDDSVYVTKANGIFPIDHRILRFDSSGVLLEANPASGGIGVGQREIFGLALDWDVGNLYVTSTTAGQHIHLLTAPPPIPPVPVTGEATPGVNPSLRTLEGTVNPEGFRVLGCYFEYGVTTAYGTTTPCVPAEPGEGTGPVPVSAETEPLELDTTYHYRLVAENGGPTGFGADRTFATGPTSDSGCVNEARRQEQGIAALMLPDCMALEMVSPPRKGGQGASFAEVSADGSRVRFLAQAALGEDPPGLIGLGGSIYVASRGVGGWASESTVPDTGILKMWESESRPSFTPDLSRWFGFGSGSAQLQQGIGEVFEAGLGQSYVPMSGPLVPLTFLGPPKNVVLTSAFAGASADHSHLYFRLGERSRYRAGDPNLSGTGQEPGNVYLARLGATGEPELLGRDRDGKVWGGNCGARLGGFGPIVPVASPARNGERNQGAMSADGSRTYFSARADQPQSGPCSEASKLRLLERLEAPGGPVIQPLFGSECTRVSPPCSNANGDDLYQGASVDQTKVYFTTNRQLADSDLDGSGEECKLEQAVAGCDLYLFDRSRLAGERLTQVSAGEGVPGEHEAGSEARVYNGITAISGDGSHVYFVATGVLTEDANPTGDEAQAGEPNLYLWETDTERSSFIGTLNSDDAIKSFSGSGLWGGQGTWRNNAYPVPVLGDGRMLFFETKAELTDEDADGAHLDLYRYDGASLQCLSCRPGAPDSEPFDIDEHLSSPPGHGEGRPAGTDYAEETRWVGEDGLTAGFQTSQGLVPGDVNEAPDFYLWRDGQLVRLPGKPFLTGRSNGPFLSHDGSTVAFSTSTALLPSDGDVAPDIYVARVNGGFPFAAKAEPCVLPDGCQAREAPPGALDPTTSNFRGFGNPGRSSNPCAGPARKAQALSKRAKRLRQRARRASRRNHRRAAHMRRKAHRLARRAKGKSVHAKRCRAKRKRANANRRAPK